MGATETPAPNPLPPSRPVFLSPDERFDVWLVKRAERPELLERAASTETPQEAQEDESEFEPEPLPLTDGCDLPGWRRHQFVALDHESPTGAALNVGFGCALLRREAQVPVPSPRFSKEWEELRRRLLEPPRNSNVAVLEAEDPALQARHPWFERENVPAVLLGCTHDWRAMKTCTLQTLCGRFGHLPWRFSDTHGETMTLDTYRKYLQWEGRLEDAPLAVYDSVFGDDERACLLDDYTVPACFDADLLECLPDDLRPPFRWILMGPARSGTGLHIDPVGTHAWVTLIEGCKRWVLFPYGTDPASIRMQEPAIPSAVWFRDHYAEAMAAHPGAVEVLQCSGETVYVPAGWPHLVLNLETSVAITHNYASAYPSLARLWHALAAAEPEAARVFRACLPEHQPELAEGMAPFDNA